MIDNIKKTEKPEDSPNQIMIYTRKFLLDYVCGQVELLSQLSEKEKERRHKLVKLINNLVLTKFETAQLSLFGSSQNGFEMETSDLDLCLTFEGLENLDREGQINVIKEIGSIFKKNRREFGRIEVRCKARVPIVKLRHLKTNIEVDICAYNELALHSTELLRHYVQIDKRVRILGLVVKNFVKNDNSLMACKNGDDLPERSPQKRSLSSYAYNIMVIHYLMNTSVPVLPCLQETYDYEYSFEQENTFIDGYDCYFYKKISNLPEHLWNNYKKNIDSTGSLWLGFLRYYTEVFDWHNDVVTIRTTKKITKNQKKWSNRKLAIEDPFKIDKNLAESIKDDEIFLKLNNLKMIYAYPFQQTKQTIEYFFGKEIHAEDIEMSKSYQRRNTISDKRRMRGCFERNSDDESNRITQNNYFNKYIDKVEKDEIIQEKYSDRKNDSDLMFQVKTVRLKNNLGMDSFDSCADNQIPIQDQNYKWIYNEKWSLLLICIFIIYYTCKAFMACLE